MDIELVILFIVIVVHVLIFQQSGSAHRKRRLLIAFSMIGGSIVLFFFGLLLGLGGNHDVQKLAIALMYAPVWLSLLSFGVYFKGEKDKP